MDWKTITEEVQTASERSKPARDQFNKEIKERLKVSRKSMDTVIDI